MPEISIPTQPNDDGSGNFTRVTSRSGRTRALHLIIQPAGDHFKIQGIGNLLDVFEDWEDEIPLTQTELWYESAAIRRTWQETAVEAKHKGKQPLMRQWDLSQDPEPEFVKRLLGPLAVAGSQLFERIFFPCTLTGRKFERLNALGEVLRSMPPQWFRVTSAEFFAPWNLMYSGDPGLDGTDARREGFWGYQHLVEHSTKAHTEARPFDDVDPFQLAAHFDTEIDTTLKVRCNQAMFDLLGRYEIDPAYRNSKSELYNAMRSGQTKEHVLYFCCHAHAGQDSRLELTDRNPIAPAEIKRWMHKGSFERRPIVFLNMCEGSQVNAKFYQGFVEVFLDKGASAIVGPQTEIPAVFAGQFASRFFEEFFGGGRRTVGEILYALRREFLDKYNNPLGLLYSLYRGADLYLSESLPLKQAASVVAPGVVQT